MGLIDKLQASMFHHHHIYPTHPNNPRTRTLPSRTTLRPPQAPQQLLHRRPIRRRRIRLLRRQLANEYRLQTIDRDLAAHVGKSDVAMIEYLVV